MADDDIEASLSRLEQAINEAVEKKNPRHADKSIDDLRQEIETWKGRATASLVTAQTRLGWRIGTAFGLGARLREFLEALKEEKILPVRESANLIEAMINRWFGATIIAVVAALIPSIILVVQVFQIQEQIHQFNVQNRVLTAQWNDQSEAKIQTDRLNALTYLYDRKDCVSGSVSNEECPPAFNKRIRYDVFISYANSVFGGDYASFSADWVYDDEKCREDFDPDDAVNLSGAILSDLDFSELDLACLNFRAADLQRTRFSQRSRPFENIDFSGSNLAGAVFVRVEGKTVRFANIRSTPQHPVDFLNSEFKETSFERAILPNANFKEAKLQGSEFNGADLKGAVFTDAAMEGSYFAGADLRDAKGLTCEQLTSSIGWEYAHRDAEHGCGNAIPHPPDAQFPTTVE